jgi:hypothetical protein
MPRRYRTPLERELLRAGPSRDRSIEAVKREVGDRAWERLVAGDATPVAWLRRRIAEALQVDVESLWPQERARPDERPRAPWRRVA